MALSLLQEMVPREILLLIIEELSTGERSSLLSLALVSHDFYYFVIPVLYRSIQISLVHREASTALLNRLSVNDTEISCFVRSVDVYGTEESSIPSSQHRLIQEPQKELHQVVLDQLANIIPRLENLAFINWRLSWDVPEGVLLRLCQSRPYVRFSVGFSSLQYPHFDTVVKLAGKALERLDIVLPFQEEVHPGKWKLRPALRRCPNLKVLKIEKDSGFGLQADPWLDIQPLDTLPRLSKLSIDESIFMLEDLRDWGDIGGWTQLEEATLKDHYPLQYLRGCEKTLHSISLTNVSGDTPGNWGHGHATGHAPNDIESALIEICSRLVCLETLRIRGTSSVSIPLEVLRICGENLKLLEIHTVTYGHDTPGENPTNDVLDSVRRNCPNINTLGINMYRTENAWPYGYLTALTGWPNLTYLILCAEQKTCTNAPHAAILDIAAAKHICQYLVDHKLGKPLKKVTIYRGDGCYMPKGLHPREYEMRITQAVFHYATVQRDGITEASVIQEGGVCFNDQWWPNVMKSKEEAKAWDAKRILGVEGGDKTFLFDQMRKSSASNGLQSTGRLRSSNSNTVELE